MKPIEYFRSFFTDEVIDMIVYQSNLYHLQQKGMVGTFSKHDILDFLAIEILMGVVERRNQWKDFSVS